MGGGGGNTEGEFPGFSEIQHRRAAPALTVRGREVINKKRQSGFLRMLPRQDDCSARPHLKLKISGSPACTYGSNRVPLFAADVDIQWSGLRCPCVVPVPSIPRAVIASLSNPLQGVGVHASRAPGPAFVPPLFNLI